MPFATWLLSRFPVNYRVQTPSQKAYVLLQIAVGPKKLNVADFGLKVCGRGKGVGCQWVFICVNALKFSLYVFTLLH